MRAGPLRRLLQYQTATEAADSLGQMVPTWTTVMIVWGEIRKLTGTEATVALQVEAFVPQVVECRFPGFVFSPKGRLVDITDANNPTVLNIVSSDDPDGRRRKLVTMTTLVASTPATGNSSL